MIIALLLEIQRSMIKIGLVGYYIIVDIFYYIE